MKCTWITLLCLLAVFAGCGKVNKIDNMTGIDAPAITDTAGDAVVLDNMPDSIIVPDSILISGNVQAMMGGGLQVCVNCELTILGSNGVDELVRSYSNSMGNFVLTLPTGGAPANVSMRALADSSTGLFNTKYNFAAPLVADHITHVKLFDRPALESLEQLAGETPPLPLFLLVVQVMDAGGRPLSGATVTTNTPNITMHYTDGLSRPVPTNIRGITASDGVAYGFQTSGTLPSPLTIGVTAPGATFLPHAIFIGDTTQIVEFMP